VRGLYRGLNACLLKVIPSMAIAFAIHERLRLTLNFDYKNEKGHEAAAKAEAAAAKAAAEAAKAAKKDE